MSLTEIQTKPIYVGPNGKEVFEFSHSQFSTYEFCPKRYEIERKWGWRQKPGAALEFGHSVEAAIRRFYQEMSDPVEVFEIQWQMFASDVHLQYPDGEDWKTLQESGVGLMTRFRKDWQKFTPRSPIFPNYRNRMLVRDSATGNDFAAIPDLIDTDDDGRYIADIKCLKNVIDIPLPHQVTLDLQLRTQAATTQIYRVALWNFCKNPKRVDRASAEEIIETCRASAAMQDGDFKALALRVSHDANDLNFEETAQLLGPEFQNHKTIQADWKRIAKDDATAKGLADTITKNIREKHKPVYVIQWLAGTMTPEHALEGVQAEMSVVPLIKADYFPRKGGVRFPKNECTWCPTRGLCLEELYGQKPEYDAVTKEELVKWDDRSMEGL